MNLFCPHRVRHQSPVLQGGALCALALLSVVGCAKPPEALAPQPEPIAEVAPELVGDPRVQVPFAQRTIARHLPSFKRCFEQMYTHGELTLDLTIEGDGHVHRAEASGHVPREVIRCVESRASRVQFESPENGAVALLSVDVSIIGQ